MTIPVKSITVERSFVQRVEEFRVVVAVNTLEPTVGKMLKPLEVQRLINDGVKVTIRTSK